MNIDGGCHCGFIAFEGEVDPGDAFICHCTDCQTLSGAPFRAVVFAKESGFRLLAGKPKIYVKTADSGRKREQTFCPECGTPIYSAPVMEGAAGGEPRTIGIRIGAIRQRNELPPKSQWYCHSAQKWLGTVANLPKSSRISR